MISVNDYFDAVFFTNLEKRTDRYRQFTEECIKHNIRAERFKDIVEGNPYGIKVPRNKITNEPVINNGVLGSLQTALNMINYAKSRGFRHYLKFEDDAVFHDDFQRLFDEFIRQLPPDWCLLYLGGWHREPPLNVKGSPNIKRVVHTHAAHAIAYNSRMYDIVIPLIKQWNKNGDVILAELQSKYPCYCFSPRLVWQRPGFSDIWQRDVNFDEYLKDG